MREEKCIEKKRSDGSNVEMKRKRRKKKREGKERRKKKREKKEREREKKRKKERERERERERLASCGLEGHRPYFRSDRTERERAECVTRRMV